MQLIGCLRRFDIPMDCGILSEYPKVCPLYDFRLVRGRRVHLQDTGLTNYWIGGSK